MKNILIVKLSAIGDVVHALPVVTALKKHLPESRITWVVEKAAYDLVASHPAVDEAILFEKAKCKTLLGFLRYVPGFIITLRRCKFDLALDLQGLLKSALIAWLSGAGQRYVYENSREGSDKFSQRVIGMHAAGGHISERYLDVVRQLGVELASGEADYGIVIAAEDRIAAERIARHAGLDLSQRYAALILGANWPNKIWPQEHFAVLSDSLYDRGIIPVVVGGPNDSQLAAMVMAQMKIPAIDLTGKTNLKQLTAILAKAAFAVGGDTGPLHLAAALKTPVVELMGPTDAARNGPYGQIPHAVTVPHQCAGCWQRKCPKEWDCLAAITPEEVLEKIVSIDGKRRD